MAKAVAIAKAALAKAEGGVLLGDSPETGREDAVPPRLRALTAAVPRYRHIRGRK
jgi:hypothetical protein